MNLFGGVKSVSEILKSFEKVVADLTAVKVHHTSEMARHKQVIADAQTAHDASSTEAWQAAVRRALRPGRGKPRRMGAQEHPGHAPTG